MHSLLLVVLHSQGGGIREKEIHFGESFLGKSPTLCLRLHVYMWREQREIYILFSGWVSMESGDSLVFVLFGLR